MSRSGAKSLTQKGTKLLTNGWWVEAASHANYLGDLIISLAMALVVGTNTLFGYGYFLAFIILLIHRDWRDDKHCAEKYDDDWKAYRKKYGGILFQGSIKAAPLPPAPFMIQ